MPHYTRRVGRTSQAQMAKVDAALMENGTDQQVWDVVLTDVRRLSSAWEEGLSPEEARQIAGRVLRLLINLRNRGDQWQMRL